MAALSRWLSSSHKVVIAVNEWKGPGSLQPLAVALSRQVGRMQTGVGVMMP